MKNMPRKLPSKNILPRVLVGILLLLVGSAAVLSGGSGSSGGTISGPARRREGLLFDRSLLSKDDNPCDECSDNESCQDMMCVCNDGFEEDPVTNVCTNVDECAIDTDTCDENADCTDTEGSFICSCGTGYAGSGQDGDCLDVDECIEPDTCVENADCTNTEGSFTCTCRTGYIWSGQESDCLDVDECSLNTDTCDENADCINTNGSYTCTCRDGFVGSGQNCEVPIQLCPGNIPVVNVTLGPNSVGGFVNVSPEQSLANVINCLDPDEGEEHTQASHVWWSGGDLELVFNFDVDYLVTTIYFWNYFTEQYDVDGIDFAFYDMQGMLQRSFSVLPRMGENAAGANANNIVAEEIPVEPFAKGSRVVATLNGTNSQIDFQNMVFVGGRAD